MRTISVQLMLRNCAFSRTPNTASVSHLVVSVLFPIFFSNESQITGTIIQTLRFLFSGLQTNFCHGRVISLCLCVCEKLLISRRAAAYLGGVVWLNMGKHPQVSVSVRSRPPPCLVLLYPLSHPHREPGHAGALQPVHGH